jgi:hypothetical protein
LGIGAVFELGRKAVFLSRLAALTRPELVKAAHDNRLNQSVSLRYRPAGNVALGAHHERRARQRIVCGALISNRVGFSRAP